MVTSANKTLYLKQEPQPAKRIKGSFEKLSYVSFIQDQKSEYQNNLLYCIQIWSNKVMLSILRWFAALKTLDQGDHWFYFIFQYRIKWNMCLSLLYPNSMLCKSFNKKRRFKNKLFFLLWIENISNNNRKYQTFRYFFHKNVGSMWETDSINFSILSKQSVIISYN